MDEQWDVAGLTAAIENNYGLKYDLQQWLDDDDHLDEEGLRARILEQMEQAYSEKEALAGADNMRTYERL